MRTVGNNENVLDSRNIQERIDELEKEIEYERAENEEEEGESKEDKKEEETEEKSPEQEELAILLAFKEEVEQCNSEWDFGCTLIRESYFEEFCQQELEDLGTIPKDISWYIVIDWEATAKNMEQDYSEVSFDGVAYLVRNT